MRSMLNNPKVVAGLCCVAFIAIAWNVMGGAGFKGSEAPTLDPGPPTTHSQLPTHEASLLGWVDQPARDPFRLVGLSQQAHGPELTQPTFRIADFRLHAIAMNPGEPMAMINGTFVAEGETIEGYVVSQIQPAGVWLEGSGEREWLGFDDG